SARASPSRHCLHRHPAPSIRPLSLHDALPISLSRSWPAVPWEAWAGFWYAGAISMFLGSVAWYEGLAAGGIARIGQLNLIQPILALGWSALLLGEPVSSPFLGTAPVVLVSMTVCTRSRIRVADP